MRRITLINGRVVSLRRSVKEAIDAYDQFVDGYTIVLEKMTNGDWTAYMSFMEDYMEAAEKFEKLQDDLTDDENLYYFEISMKVLQRAKKN